MISPTQARALFPAMLLLALSGPAGAAEQTILPGLWESQNHVSFPAAEDSTSQKCITPKLVEQFMSGPAIGHYQCNYSHMQVRGGRMSATGQCVDRNGIPATIQVDGVYTPTSFDLQARAVVSLGGLPIPITATTKARRIAEACPADAAPSEPKPPSASGEGAPVPAEP